jgi:hypothetical protein
MKTLLIWIGSFVIAGVIISPFFWLKFLKEKSRWLYVIWSSAGTIVIFLLYIYFGYDLIGNLTAKISADLYYMAYEFTQNAIYIVLILILLAPFIFTKIVYEKFKMKSVLISLVLSFIIFISLFLFWAYVLLPIAFSKLHDYL